MGAKAFIGASLLALLSTVSACSCAGEPPLSTCTVGDNQAALLVDVVGRYTTQCGPFDRTAISTVVIKRVFKDNTDLGLGEGSTVTVSSSLDSNFCGYPLDLGTSHVILANAPPTADEDDSDDSSSGSRRLLQQQTATFRISANGNGRNTVRARGSNRNGACSTPTADLSTGLCAGNFVLDEDEGEMLEQIEAVEAACAEVQEVDESD